jgi:hypothetical protein
MSHEEEDTCHLSVRLSTCLRAKAHQPASVDRYKHRHGQKADMRTYHTDMRATPLDLKKNTKNTEEHRIAGLSLNSSLTFCEVLCDHPPSPRSPPPPPMLTPFCASESCGFGRAGSERMHDTQVHARTRTRAHTRNRWRREMT